MSKKRARWSEWLRSGIFPTAAAWLLVTQTCASGQATLNVPDARSATVYEPGDVYLPGSRVYVFVGKTGFGHEHAVIGQLKQGRLRLDVPRDSGQLVFDMATFVADADAARQYVGLPGTTDASTQQQVTANMLGSAVLDVARFPTAEFRVRELSLLPQAGSRGLPQYQFSGNLTLHGVTRPVQIVAEAEQQGGWIHLRGEFSLLQTQFGITPFAKAFGALGVTDQLRVLGDVWLAKERQVAQQPGGEAIR
jgi:polyisoprenoid-binding protein YceI